ncbi:MAG: hypothetical protein ABL953_03435 [Ilumatobacteraceae bacterium]
MNITRIRVSALVSAIALLTVACSDSQKIGDPSTTTASGSTTTVVPTTVAPTVTTAPTDSTVAPETTVAAVPPTLGPPPFLLGTPLGAPTNLIATPGGGITLFDYTCSGFDPGIPGWHLEDCQIMPSYSDGVQVLVLRRNDDGRFGVAVLFRSGINWVQRYFAEEPDAGVWSDVTVVLGDMHFDDGAEVWVGYRYAGSGGYLDIDVLDPLPDGVFFLGGLQGLDHGSVELHPGGATVVTAVYADGEPNCCPGHFLVRDVTFDSGQWEIDNGLLYTADAVPSISGDF